MLIQKAKNMKIHEYIKEKKLFDLSKHIYINNS